MSSKSYSKQDYLQDLIRLLGALIIFSCLEYF